MLAVTLSSGFPAVVGSRTGVEGAAGGDTTVKVCAFDIPPPGVGLNTVMLNVPAVVRSVAGIETVNCVELTTVVVLAEPANCTTDVDTKSVPFTVSVNAAAPTILFVGEMLVVVGTGLFTVRTCAFDVPPPGVGLNTVMLNVPAVVRSLARIVAVTCVELTKLVVRFEPANCTTDVDTKFVPFTVSVNVAPTILFVGEMLVVVGRGLITVKGWALDVPPPAGLNTVMLNVPAVVRSVAGIEAVN